MLTNETEMSHLLEHDDPKCLRADYLEPAHMNSYAGQTEACGHDNAPKMKQKCTSEVRFSEKEHEFEAHYLTGEAKTAAQTSLSTEVAEARGAKNLHESDVFDSLEHL